MIATVWNIQPFNFGIQLVASLEHRGMQTYQFKMVWITSGSAVSLIHVHMTKEFTNLTTWSASINLTS